MPCKEIAVMGLERKSSPDYGSGSRTEKGPDTVTRSRTEKSPDYDNGVSAHKSHLRTVMGTCTEKSPDYGNMILYGMPSNITVTGSCTEKSSDYGNGDTYRNLITVTASRMLHCPNYGSNANGVLNLMQKYPR
jgi:hypothetical protein